MNLKHYLIVSIALFLIAGLANAAPWAHRYDDPTDGQIWESTNVPNNTTLQVSVEWGEGDWDGAMGSAFGVGSSQDGSGWTWYELPWFEDGDNNNKRCHANVLFSDNGTNWWAYRIIKASNGGTNYHNGSVDWSETYSPLSASAYVYIIPEPTSIFLILLGLGFLIRWK